MDDRRRVRTALAAAGATPVVLAAAVGVVVDRPATLVGATVSLVAVVAAVLWLGDVV